MTGTAQRPPIGPDDVAARAIAVLRAAPAPAPSADLAERAAAAALARPRSAPFKARLDAQLDDVAQLVRAWSRPAAFAACGVAVVLSVAGWRGARAGSDGAASPGLELVSADDVTEAVLPFSLAEAS